MKKITNYAVCIFVLSTIVSAAPKTGREVMQKVEDNDTSIYGQNTSKMILIDSSKRQRMRSFKQWRMKRGKKTSTIIKFLTPALDKNTGLLTLNYPNKKSDQWLYLPNLKDTKRIASSDKGKSFMGSDFYYEDFEKRDIDKFSYTLKGKKVFNKKNCYMVISIPKPKTDSAYSKIISWVDMKDFVILKSVFYEKSKLTKVLYQSEIKKIQGIQTAQKMIMKSIASRHTTVMQIKAIKYNKKVSSATFSARFLQKKL